jgi:hypothetical protein
MKNLNATYDLAMREQTLPDTGILDAQDIQLGDGARPRSKDFSQENFVSLLAITSQNLAQNGFVVFADQILKFMTKETVGTLRHLDTNGFNTHRTLLTPERHGDRLDEGLFQRTHRIQLPEQTPKQLDPFRRSPSGKKLITAQQSMGQRILCGTLPARRTARTGWLSGRFPRRTAHRINAPL